MGLEVRSRSLKTVISSQVIVDNSLLVSFASTNAAFDHLWEDLCMNISNYSTRLFPWFRGI